MRATQSAAVNDLLPSFESLLSSARDTAPNLRVSIALYFTSVSRGIVVRPFSAFPSTAALISTSPNASTDTLFTPNSTSPSEKYDPFSDAFCAPSARVDIRPGRPDYQTIFDGVVAASRTRSNKFENKFQAGEGAQADCGVAVAACGPSGMVASLRGICALVDEVEFHAE